MSAPGFEYFDYTSSGAPVLQYGVGKLVAVLDWLLTGKGGWATEFTGTNLRVYRSATGNRFRLRLDDTQALYSRLHGYRAMTAVSTGTQPFPAVAMAPLANFGVRRGYDASDTGALKYWGIRTNRYFLMVYEQTSTAIAGASYRNVFAFGDFPSVCEADSHNTVLIASASAQSFVTVDFTSQFLQNVIYASTNYPLTESGNTCAGLSGNPSGSVVAPACGIHLPWPATESTSLTTAVAESGRLNFAPVMIGNTNSATANQGAIPRGMLPNLQQLYHIAPDGVADANYPCQAGVPFTIGSRTFLPLSRISQATPQYMSCVLLEVTDTDGAL